MPSRSRPEWLGPETDDIAPAVSTSSHAFQAILDDLVRTVDLPAAPAAPPSAEPRTEAPLAAAPLAAAPASDPPPAGPPPARLSGKGDLTLVVGLGRDALDAARILAAGSEADIHPVADRRAALAARADGVRRGCAIVAPVELDAVDAVPSLAADLASIAPDQVWVAVDVSRRPEDTAHWVSAVDAVLAVDGIAASGARRTSGPLGLASLARPVLWLDTPPA